MREKKEKPIKGVILLNGGDKLYLGLKLLTYIVFFVVLAGIGYITYMGKLMDWLLYVEIALGIVLILIISDRLSPEAHLIRMRKKDKLEEMPVVVYSGSLISKGREGERKYKYDLVLVNSEEQLIKVSSKTTMNIKSFPEIQIGQKGYLEYNPKTRKALNFEEE